MGFMVCVLSCGCVRRMCSCVCACEQIARTRSGDKGFKNVPAPARETPPINPENYTLRFPQDKKWVVQNSCPKVDLSFFGKKGQRFCDSIRSGLIYAFGCKCEIVAIRGYRMARGWRYTKLSYRLLFFNLYITLNCPFSCYTVL